MEEVYVLLVFYTGDGVLFTQECEFLVEENDLDRFLSELLVWCEENEVECVGSYPAT